jgi:hypothetical protein
VCPLFLYVSSSLCRFTVPHTFFLFLISHLPLHVT